MAGVFDEILTTGVRSGQVPSRTKNAREWYRTRAQEYGRLIGCKYGEGFTTERCIGTSNLLDIL
jgi:hypothetical protein